MILREMMLEVVIEVLVTEVDKVADMEFDKVTDMKIPIENLTDMILPIVYLVSITYRDYVRSGQQVGRHVELIQVGPPVDQILN